MLAVVVALPLSAAAASAAPPPAASFKDTVLSSANVRFLSVDAAFWGGKITASTGETVDVEFSDSYPQDPAMAQHWADLLASFLHGPEVGTVTLYLAPFDEVRRFCGQGALACYSDRAQQIVGSADRVDPDISPESVVMHEFGHHVAASSDNEPWEAIDYGPKRWSSYEQVCAKTRGGQLFPGDESSNYRLNPGEAWAETYRVLNERRLGYAESGWDIVSNLLYPDATALSLAAQDVTSPWKGNTATSSTFRLSTRAKTRRVAFVTPLDGNLQVTLRGARNSRAAFDLYGSDGTRLLHSVVSGTATKSLRTTICGSRTYAAKVALQRGAGAFRLTVSKP